LPGIEISQQACHGAFHFAIWQQRTLRHGPVRVFALNFYRGNMGHFVFVGANYVSKAEATTLQNAVQNFRVVHSFPPSKVRECGQFLVAPRPAYWERARTRTQKFSLASAKALRCAVAILPLA